MAIKDSGPIAAIYETPPFFQKIKMPHFWMSYFQVDSVSWVADIANKNGGKVELIDSAFNNGKIALIRDPQGAGFTIYNGNDLFLNQNPSHGSVIETELHVSNSEKVLPFYASIFNWNYTETKTGIYLVKQSDDAAKITIRELPNDIKGKFEYWVMTILVNDLKESTELILQEGGTIISKDSDRIMLSDNTNEAFFYIKEKY